MSNIELHIDSEIRRAKEAYDAAYQASSWKETATARKAYDRAVLKKLADAAGEPVGVLAYSSNNSGGGWWINTAGWEALESAGWVVHWGREVYEPLADVLTRPERTGDTFLGAEATSCVKVGTDPQELVDEWSRLTGESPADQGCNCCGPPHSFTWHAPDGSEVSPGVSVVEVWEGF